MKRIVLLLSVGAIMLAMLAMSVAPASAATFSNNSGITINDGSDGLCVGGPTTAPGKADPYPSPISVSGLGSSVLDVNVTLTGLAHTFPDDVGVLLVGPEGQKTILMSDVGGEGTYPASGMNLTFDDEASSGALPDDGPLSSGTYQPTRGTLNALSCLAPESFPAPAPTGPYASPSLSVFDGTNPNGTWELYVIDDSVFDTGSITGWSLDISATTTAADTTPPTVMTTSTPTNKAANVTATFSEEVQNVSPETFFLERRISVKKASPKYVLVDATVSLINGTYVLDPVLDLPKGDYRATITTDVTDKADNALEEDVVWTFKVAK